MGFTRRNRITYYVLFSAVLCVWLCGSNGTESGFKIFRSERDIFTKCTDSCTESQPCEMYHAECVNATCEYCRCLEGTNTLMIIKDDERECKSDEEIVPESGSICTLPLFVYMLQTLKENSTRMPHWQFSVPYKIIVSQQITQNLCGQIWVMNSAVSWR